jgi:hypothetical protein
VLEAPQQDRDRPRIPEGAQEVDRVEQSPLGRGLVVRQPGLQEGDQRRDHGRPGGQALPTEGLGQRAGLGTEGPDEGLGRRSRLSIIEVVERGHRVVLHTFVVVSHVPFLGRL